MGDREKQGKKSHNKVNRLAQSVMVLCTLKIALSATSKTKGENLFKSSHWKEKKNLHIAKLKIKINGILNA